MTHSWPVYLSAFLSGGSPEVVNLVEEEIAEMAKVVDRNKNMVLLWIAVDSLDGSRTGGQRSPHDHLATERRDNLVTPQREEFGGAVVPVTQLFCPYSLFYNCI